MDAASADASINSMSGMFDAMLNEALWFIAGLLIFRLVLPRLWSGPGGRKKAAEAATFSKHVVDRKMTASVSSSSKAISAAAASGRYKEVLATWNCKHIGLALKQILDMHEQSVKVPAKVVTALVKVAAATNIHGGSNGEDAATTAVRPWIPEVVDTLRQVPVPAEAIGIALVDCLARDDLRTALKLEVRLRENRQLSYGVMEPLLKLSAKLNEDRALQLFQEMQDNGYFLSEGLCGLLLSRCGESRHLRLAETVSTYLKSKGMMTLAVYKTLMKVYATCQLFDKACALYYDLKADGIQPDKIMYGCLVKFAVKCGQSELVAELSEKVQGDTQNYSWLIRSAGQAGNVCHALELLQKLKSMNSDGPPQSTVYNSVLDACLSNGAMNEAEELLQEMREHHLMTLVTYNTLMKGLCFNGQLAKARALLDEMRMSGLTPDCASFNCLISAAVSNSNFADAWDIFEEMERQGLSPDHYTLSIIMKSARKSKRPSDANRAMDLLDRSEVDMGSDEVLLNTVVDACIYRKDHRRLRKILDSLQTSTLAPSVQSYGLLIKAHSCIKRPDKCWKLWNEMLARHLRPNDVTLSCMMDSLVCDGKVEQAAQLLEQWQEQLQPNTVVYSTLIKGFASQGNAEKAVQMYREVKKRGLHMNQVAFTALIDAHVRAEKMEQAEDLLKQMQADGIEPNTITYSALVKGYSRTGKLDRALKTFDDMLSRGLEADTVIFNTLLDGAIRASRFELCDQVLAEMAKHEVHESNFTLSIIIKMWGKRKCLDAAFKVAREKTKTSLQRLDSQICTCLISACLHNHAQERALEALHEMKSWPNCDGPDASTYNMLLGGLLRCGWAREAAAVATEALHVRFSLNHEVLAQLFKSLQKAGLQRELLSLDQLLRLGS
eukprot:TRINITY_DN2853_c0_g1_i1.p1 TRINITY_DN2853_c0_g1~~TRINITY_DN2853_c0_g1_i1.p1  ORF type:complete len:945 (+),score=197.35 TRINITY_DN2853_c0_g1_i1:162-2837(+)